MGDDDDDVMNDSYADAEGGDDNELVDARTSF